MKNILLLLTLSHLCLTAQTIVLSPAQQANWQIEVTTPYHTTRTYRWAYHPAQCLYRTKHQSLQSTLCDTRKRGIVARE